MKNLILIAALLVSGVAQAGNQPTIECRSDDRVVIARLHPATDGLQADTIDNYMWGKMSCRMTNTSNGSWTCAGKWNDNRGPEAFKAMIAFFLPNKPLNKTVIRIQRPALYGGKTIDLKDCAQTIR